MWHSARILWGPNPLQGGGGSPVEPLISHTTTQSHWSSGWTVCFPPLGAVVCTPGCTHTSGTGILLLAMSHYSVFISTHTHIYLPQLGIDIEDTIAGIHTFSPVMDQKDARLLIPVPDHFLYLYFSFLHCTDWKQDSPEFQQLNLCICLPLQKIGSRRHIWP